jgi:hypothetical protein
MPTTTVVFKFTPESSQQALDEKFAIFNAQPKRTLHFVFEQYGLTEDNLVSDTVDAEKSLRTVVRSWSNDTIAKAFIDVSLGAMYAFGDAYPGKIISAQVDPTS